MNNRSRHGKEPQVAREHGGISPLTTRRTAGSFRRTAASRTDLAAPITTPRAAAPRVGRLSHAQHLLGWPLLTPQGRLRLQLALTMRHLARS
ncbi:hypothetical protein [Streptomyces canus]|uniref:hypothetical protein n=1 Tax=Streptomyces canus TaxID=58343 RepID=UPI002781B97B|nr:hypothetical protein [Streptomyces canus]MDQ1065759.1 hypothetical protein [Streptomyces canus]